MPPATRRPLLLALLLVAVLGYAYGALTAAVPSPEDPDVFWVSNLAAPYAVLPFLGGARCARAWQPGRAVPAIAAGAVLGGCAIAGFYGLHRVGRDPQADMGYDESLAGAYARWFSTFVLGRPGGIPWLTIAVAVGAAAGLLGWLWVSRGSALAGALGVAPLLVEPVLRAAGMAGLPLTTAYPRLPINVAIWAGELAVGAVALWWGRSQTPGPAAPADLGSNRTTV